LLNEKEQALYSKITTTQQARNAVRLYITKHRLNQEEFCVEIGVVKQYCFIAFMKEKKDFDTDTEEKCQDSNIFILIKLFLQRFASYARHAHRVPFFYAQCLRERKRHKNWQGTGAYV